MHCWGSGYPVGLGGTSASTPTAVPGIADAVSIATGNRHTCALHQNGTASCWGDGAGGQLGVDRVPYARLPGKVLWQ